jgi:hypothetical protein
VLYAALQVAREWAKGQYAGLRVSGGTGEEARPAG